MPLKKPKNHTVADMYRAWCIKKLSGDSSLVAEYDSFIRKAGINILYRLKKDGSKEMVMNYTTFRLIIELHNKYVGECIIQGGKFNLGGQLGYIFAAKMERSHNKPRVDIISTMRARREDANHPAIYFLDDYYLMVKWQKIHKVQNELVYVFSTAKHSLKRDFHIANRDNPFLQSLYRYYPLINRKTA